MTLLDYFNKFCKKAVSLFRFDTKIVFYAFRAYETAGKLMKTYYITMVNS